MTKIVGRHTIKVGYHFTDVILTNYFIQRVLGNYEYSTLQQYVLRPDPGRPRRTQRRSDQLSDRLPAT